MPQGQIRKGFFFYFGLFVLLLLAGFCVCLVVMMFNPGKTVLWMQYFTANQDYRIEKTTDEAQTEINYNALTGIQIDATSFANIKVQKTKDYQKTGVYIVNKAKGFASAKNAKAFDCSVSLEGTTLIVNIQEPTGFLYISKDIEIIVHMTSELETNLDYIVLSAKTGSGYIGVGESGKDAKNVQLKGLTAETVDGNIYLTDYFDMSRVDSNIKLKSHSGKIEALGNIEYETGKTANGIKVGCDVEISNTKGRVNAGAIVCNNLELKTESGDMKIDNIKTSGATKVTCSKGNFVFGKITNNISFAKSEDTLLSPNVTITELDGDFLINGRELANPDIKISKINGKFTSFVDQGSIFLGEANGEISIQSENSLTANVVVGENNDKNITIKNKNGDIKIGFLGNVKGSTEIISENGKVFVNVLKNAKFTAMAYKSETYTDENLLEESKITVSIDNSTLDPLMSKNPLKVNGGATTTESGIIKIVTKNHVTYSNKTADQIKAQDEVVA